MTSSLVGSEMCIRDSILTMDTKGRPQVKHGLHPTQLQPQDNLARNLFETVSYTHLTLPTICSV
eukprot:10929668-Prorocentrum_lima.AAC.1